MENTEEKVYNLDNEVDMEVLIEELNKGSEYFKPEDGVTYKFKLKDIQIKPIQKQNKENPFVKYAMNIEARNKNGVVWDGVWEAPKIVMAAVAKSYKKNNNMNFTLQKTGTGMDTKYNVTEDY